MLSATTFQPNALTSAGIHVRYRAAIASDIPAISVLIAAHTGAGQLLPRSNCDIRATLANWIVAEIGGTLIGCGSLHPASRSRVELRSLVVRADYRGHGVGTGIVHLLVAQAWNTEADCVYALTRAVAFFGRLGFQATERALFPEKLVLDCALCWLRERCDETAMWLHRG